MLKRRSSEENLIENEETTATDDFVGHSAFAPAILNDDAYAHNQPEPQQQIIVKNDPPPPDHLNFTYMVFYLLGCATMTPWNFFVTAEDYWMYKFRNTTINSSMIADTELTPMQKSFACDLTLTASISGTTFLILNAVYGQRVSLKMKILFPLVVILVMFGVTTLFVEINTDAIQEQFFLMTLFTVILINISSATMSGGILGIAGLFPSEYMTALVSGQALGGIFTALAFIMVLALELGPNATAMIFFLIGSVLILFCIVLYTMMSRSAFFLYYINGGDKSSMVVYGGDSVGRQLDGVNLEPNLRVVMGKIYTHVVSIALLYATTLSVYPAISVLMQSENYGHGRAWNDIYYMPVVNYLFFNSGDYFGRILAGLWAKPDNAATILLMTALRVLYIPFFLCSNTNLHQFLPILVHSDVAFILMVLSFAVINGYLTNLNLMMAPKCVKHHEREMASSIMAASLSSGLALGSVLSMIFVQLL